MKTTLTLLALLLSGVTQAQSHLQNTCFTVPAGSKLQAERIAEAGFGPGFILREQSRPDAQAKNTATAHRLTGWSRHDLDAGIQTDTTFLQYTGMRGSSFGNEQMNLLAGTFLTNTQPDRFIRKDKDGGIMDIEQRYDASNRVIQRTFRSTMYRSKSVMTYDAAGNIATTIESDSAAGTWTPQIARYFRYNAAGTQVFDSVFSIQDNEPQSISYYRLNNAGMIDTFDSYAWNGSAFERQYMTVNTRSAAGSIIYSTSYFVDESGNLIANERFDYIYTPSKELKEDIFSFNVNGTWVPRSRDTFGYTGAKTLNTYLQNDIWDESAGTWEPQRSYTYTLDSKNRWNTEYFSDRKSSGGLVPMHRRDISYNANDLVLETKSYDYVPASGGYSPTAFEQEHFYYESHQTTSVNGAQKIANLRLYPNPANTEISLQSGSSEVESAVILGASGLRMNAAIIVGRTQKIDISALPIGLYFLMVRLSDGSAPQTLRFIKN